MTGGPMDTKVKRDCIIVLLLTLALILTACAGKRRSVA